MNKSSFLKKYISIHLNCEQQKQQLDFFNQISIFYKSTT